MGWFSYVYFIVAFGFYSCRILTEVSSLDVEYILVEMFELALKHLNTLKHTGYVVALTRHYTMAFCMWRCKIQSLWYVYKHVSHNILLVSCGHYSSLGTYIWVVYDTICS